MRRVLRHVRRALEAWESEVQGSVSTRCEGFLVGIVRNSAAGRRPVCGHGGQLVDCLLVVRWVVRGGCVWGRWHLHKFQDSEKHAMWISSVVDHLFDLCSPIVVTVTYDADEYGGLIVQR